ncbi:sensor histidine kinase [Planosporangium thailandense]|uniref:sensor histidine kinase n=1 Tax=Planosporangium thailandense TaxID=765197 RepID=UPI0030B81ADA
MNVQTPLQALRRRGLLRSRWPWRSAAYLLTTLPVIAVAGPLFAVLGLPWLYLMARHDQDRPSIGTVALLVVLGAVFVGGLGPVVAVPLGVLERARLRMVDDRAAGSGHRRPGPLSWLRVRYPEEATWRALAYALLLVTLVPAMLGLLAATLLMIAVLIAGPWLVGGGGEPVQLGLVSVGDPVAARWWAVVGVVLVPAVPYLVTFVAGAHAALARALLDGHTDGRLRAELVEVTRSRARLVDTFAAERRRIERDLHDGAQQRLVSLSLQLGLARLDVPPDSAAAVTIATAHEQAKQLMDELRELIHGIYPQVLGDVGLPTALQELADRSPVPVTVDADLPARPAAPAEVAAYFMVAEALTNAAKHSGATQVAVVVRQQRDTLTVEVSDNGRGGADPSRGTGLTGLADRVAAGGGRMLLSSPAAGPTVLRLELPCG